VPGEAHIEAERRTVQGVEHERLLRHQVRRPRLRLSAWSRTRRSS